MARTRYRSRSWTWLLTAIGAALFLLLSAAFGSGLLTGPLWNAASWMDSPLITYLLVGIIVVAGAVQARTRPADGRGGQYPVSGSLTGGMPPSRFAERIAGNAVLLALPLRLFVGRAWLSSGLGKITNPAWTDTGQALHGFWQGAVAVNEAGRGKITYGWYRGLLLFMDTHHWYVWFAKLIAGGELLVGLALLLGGFVGIAALGGAFLNLNYGLAGSASANPILLTLGALLVLAWRSAGYWGVDRWLLPRLGVEEHAVASVDAAGASRALTLVSQTHAVDPARPLWQPSTGLARQDR
jgi:thiosulfate dehydrogenase [quinone] large subunit